MADDSDKSANESPPRKRPKTGADAALEWWSVAWTPQTNSWELIQHIVEADKEEAVKQYLTAKVPTLERLLLILNSFPLQLLDLVRKGVNCDSSVFEQIQSKLDALQDIATSLNGQFFGEMSAGFPHHAVNLTAQSCVSLETTREGSPPPILVLGSSGSGKTTFAGKVLPQKILDNRIFKSSKSFTVYMHGSDATRGREARNIREMAEYTKKQIFSLIETDMKINIENEKLPINMAMIVIIDEMGISHDAKYLDQADKLRKLTELLQTIAEEVQLVMVGTGLDKVSSSLNSNQDAVKIRMRPWEIESVVRLAELMDVRDEVLLNRLKDTPIFLKLSSNARAAYFLLDSLRRFDDYFEDTALIDAVVKDVAFRYIKANGLKDLNTEQRRSVAKFVLGVLQGAKKGVPNFHLGCEHDETIERCCYCLIETHIECGRLSSGQNFAVTISPAIAVVLTALMGNISSLSPSWSGFERTAALSELQRLFVEADAREPVPVMSIRRSRVAFPATVVRRTIKVPKLEKHTVLVNGSGAPYADLISHYRLIQCKHSARSVNPTLNVMDELAKMGLLKNKWYDNQTDVKKRYYAQRFMAKHLIAQWQDVAVGEREPQGTQINPDSLAAENIPDEYDQLKEGDTRSMYPFGKLLSVKDPLDEINFEQHQWGVDNEGRPNAQFSHVFDTEVLNDLEANKTITVVFSTNKGGFKIHDGIHDGIEIARKHVDNEGELRIDDDHIGSEANKRLLKFWKKNCVDMEKVKIAFQFSCC
jgi:hypothetical protein